MKTAGLKGLPNMTPAEVQEVADRLYASYGLPLEGGSNHSLLSTVLPQLVQRMHPVIFKGLDVERAGLKPFTWEGVDYELYSAFERHRDGAPGSHRNDRTQSLHLSGILSLETTSECAPYVRVFCTCWPSLESGDSPSVELTVQCDICVLIKYPASKETPLYQQKHIFEMAHVQRRAETVEFRGVPSQRAIDYRRSRVSQLKTIQDELAAQKRKVLKALAEDGRPLPYSEVERVVGSELQKLLFDSCDADTWIRVEHAASAREPSPTNFLAHLYCPDGYGGLRPQAVRKIMPEKGACRTDQDFCRLLVFRG